MVTRPGPRRDVSNDGRSTSSVPRRSRANRRACCQRPADDDDPMSDSKHGSVRLRVVESIGYPARHRTVVPVAAPQDPRLTTWGPGWIEDRRLLVVGAGVLVFHPLADVPKHVMESPSICDLLAHRVGLSPRVSCTSPSKPGDRRHAVRIIGSVVIRRRRPGPTRKLPLCLRRQTKTGRHLETLHGIPRHLLDGSDIAIWKIPKLAWVVSHHGLPLRLRHFVAA
jgi:hypothetical protein